MTNVALLIGVSECDFNLSRLPAAARDVQAMGTVLTNLEVGVFAELEVQKLVNPDSLEMREAVETLFNNRQKDDLILLYFSGHGVKDDRGKLHLATRTTRKTAQGELVKATAVEASFIKETMSNSRAMQQVVILDCCFSGAFADDMSAKAYIDVKEQLKQLGGYGRAILTSSTSTQYSFEQKGSELSTYTRYLVEGIQTGAADLDNDGEIAVEELHEYVKQKVHEAVPAMKPEIYPVREGYRIVLAKAPIGNPELKYRKTVERCVTRNEEISGVSRKILSYLQVSLGLSFEEAAAIEAEVLEPIRRRKQNLQEYKEAFNTEILRKNPIKDDVRNELKHLQQVLGLRDKDIEQVEEEVISQIVAIPPTKNLPEAPTLPSKTQLKSPESQPQYTKKTRYLLIGIGAGITASSLALLVSNINNSPRQPVIQPTFADVSGVPKGLFKYAGSTSWAPLHKKIFTKIQDVWPQFKLEYIPSDIPGSGTGVQMLLSKQITFSQSSRGITGEEQQEAKKQGFKLKHIPVAIDGIVIAVNPKLKIAGLTLTDLKNIYTGKVTNWKQVVVNGPNLKITPYSRGLAEGGTVEFFSKKVLDNAHFSGNVRYVSRTTEGLNAVVNNPGGIYYASAPEVLEQCKIRPLPIGEKHEKFITPYQKPLITTQQCLNQRKYNQLNTEAFQSEQYPLTRQLFVIVKQDNARDQKAGEAYANLLLTDEGQELIRKAGFVRFR